MIVTAAEWAALLPSLILIIAGLVVVGVDLFLKPAAGRLMAFVITLGSVIASADMFRRHLVFNSPVTRGFAGAFVLDDMAAFLSLAVLGATALVSVVGFVDVQRRHIPAGEFFGLLLLSASGMTTLVSGADFLTIFISIEIMSIALYVLTGITRRNPRSNEAAMKYLVSGAFATGFVLMGIALVYGSTGSVQLATVGASIAKLGVSPLLGAGIGLVIVGFAFKVGAVPFHMWVPDVYEGAPTVTTMFMSVTVKTASIGALIRILLTAFSGASVAWAGLLWWIALSTMVLGNLLAVRQQSVKRMLAYSSVAHTGYSLVALATMVSTTGTFSAAGASSALFYMVSYTFMTLGAFATLIYVGHEVQVPGRAEPEWQDAEHIDDLAGLAERRPWAAFAMALFLISLGGIPPTAGFAGKLALFSAALAQGHYTLAIIGVLASLVSMYYYMKVIVAMYMTESVSVDEKPSPLVGGVVMAAVVAVVLVGLLPDQLLLWATESIKMIKG